jgi:plastocyanin
MRAAAVETIRFEARHLPEALAFLTTAARDIHPRVRMAVVHVVSHLRATEADSIQPAPASHGAHEGHSVHAGSPFPWTTALEGMSASEPAILQMLADLKTGVKPTKGRSIPVLEVNPATRVAFWLQGGGSGPEQKTSAAPAKKDKGGAKPAAPSTRLYRSFVEADTPQTVILSVKHGYVDISANGVQLLSADSPYSSQQQVQFELQKGLNILEITFRRLKPKGEMPPVFVYDTVGQLVGGARFAEDDAALKNFAATWEKAHAADANALKVQAVVNLMQFTPKELRVKAGQPVRLVFENPDLMQHNLVVVAPGADEEVGGLADQMAAKPDGATRNFVPDSNKILHATPLVNPNGRAELKFTAPAQPGLYPYLCTFPGHWRVMRGVLVVE